MNPLGEKFDPKFHIAVEHTITEDEKKDGMIIEVKKKGYILGDRVMKAAQVVVAEYSDKSKVESQKSLYIVITS